MQNKRKTLISVAIAVAIIITLAIIGGVTAKYIFENNIDKGQISAKDFYFTIDILGDTTDVENLTTRTELYGGSTQQIGFAVQNFYDSERISAKDISYDISVACNNSFNGFELRRFNEKIALDSSFVIAGGSEKSDDYFLNIESGYEEDIELTITVQSTAPYTKKMEITLVLHPHGADVLYRVVDSADSPYATLAIMSSVDIPKEKLTIDWSSINGSENVLQIDTTNPYIIDEDLTLTTNNPGKSYLKAVTNTRNIKTLESINVYFFKIDSAKSYATLGDYAAVENEDGTYTITL